MIANKRARSAARDSTRTRSRLAEPAAPVLPARHGRRRARACSAPGSRAAGAAGGTARASSRPRPISAPEDRAAHSWGGRRTPRVEPMYADGGHLYVFLVYGMHHCANVVTRREGVAEAVLLRAAEGPEGAPPRLLSGPGKLCAALGITTARQRARSARGGRGPDLRRRRPPSAHRRLAAHRRGLRRRGEGLAAALLRPGLGGGVSHPASARHRSRRK